MKPLTGKNKKAVWEAFKSVADNVLGSRRAENYGAALSKLLTKYREICCKYVGLKYLLSGCLRNRASPKWPTDGTKKGL